MDYRGLIQAHRTTLIFVNTRKLAERLTARLTDVLGEEQSHASQQPLKAAPTGCGASPQSGTLRAVATASWNWDRHRRVELAIQ